VGVDVHAIPRPTTTNKTATFFNIIVPTSFHRQKILRSGYHDLFPSLDFFFFTSFISAFLISSMNATQWFLVPWVTSCAASTVTRFSLWPSLDNPSDLGGQGSRYATKVAHLHTSLPLGDR